MTTPYDDEFFDEITAEATASASVVARRLIDLVAPSSVVDIGCGRGAWLAAFVAEGVDDVVGIDGDYHEPAQRLLRDDQFVAADLASPPTLPRSFDLAICLEVIEHLDAAAGDHLVEYLTSLAPAVAFSAAVPGQGGVHHVNEQWPGYWHERFMDRGYHCFDVLRAPLWSHPSVSFWYAQNLLLYVRDTHPVPEALTEAPALTADAGGAPLALVHPELLRRTAALAGGPRPPASFQSLVRALPSAATSAARRVIADRRRSP
jgi:SAM-dependent methyltransferase